MHPELLTILSNHPDAYFQVFTNGHFITDEVARELRQLGNVTPLISVEGTEIVSDQRRGKNRGTLQDDGRFGKLYPSQAIDGCCNKCVPDQYRRPGL